LRERIAAYVAAARGVIAEPEQVILVRGTHHAIDLAGRVLLEPGDTVCVEDPGYLVSRAALAGLGLRLAPVRVDAEGLTIAALRRHAAARAALVTPSNHFPLGVTLSLQRRHALLEWARTCDAWIVEDDYDSEFRYLGDPVTALHGLDGGARVLYVGTFSKTLFPALRLAYLIVPPDLADGFAAARATLDHHASTVDQAVLAEFIGEGHFARHVQRMRRLYRRRRDTLVAAVHRELGGVVTLDVPHTGLHAVAWLPPDLGAADVSSRALALGIEAAPLSLYCATEELPPALLLGFSAIDETAIASGVQRLAGAIEAAFRARRRKVV
jgi:GntR family transcriptional regulator/MocR family aminotransferase